MRAAFGSFLMDRAARQLFRDGEPVHLEPKAFDLLCLLLERRPEAVSKAAIRDRLWPKTFVSDASLTGLVGQVRHALGDSRTEPRYLRTVHAFGYAFCGVVSTRPSSRKAAQPRVLWAGRVFALNEGENILGRDEGAAAQIDLPGISRRHARIVVEHGRATLEDLGSKNGTSLNEGTLTAPTLLSDGDTFRLGRHLLVYRSTPTAASTRSEAPI